MNPLLLLFGLIGTGAAAALGSDKDKTDVKGIGKKETIPETTDTTDPADTTDTTGTDTTGTGTTGTDTTGTDTTGTTETTTATDTTNSTDTTPSTGDTGTDPVVTEPQAPEQTGSGGADGASTTPTIADGTVDVIAGRVATLSPAASDAVSVEIVSGVEHGTVTVNPDGTFALVMTQSGFTGSQSFTYSAQHEDGSVTTHQVDLNVTPGLQDQGWGTGEAQYMLATDENDRVIVEHGDVHTKVYISGSSSALSLADVARIEGIDVSQVTGGFLAENGYGQSEDLALAQDAGMTLWTTVTPDHSQTSNWLLLESGYDYADLGRIFGRGVGGESEMNPLYVGAWGDGDAPKIATAFDMTYQYGYSNIVVQDVHIGDGSLILKAENLLFDNVTFTGDEVAIQWSSGVTIRNSEFFDIYREESKDGGDWETHSDRIQALYMNETDGALIENAVFDLNGWNPDGQPPSMFSHNMYFGAHMDDVTVRDSIFMRGASYGAQVRSGGFIEDNVFLDNNAAFTALGGDYNDAGPIGNYTLMTDNLVTSGAHKEAFQIGGLTMGILETGELTSMVDNIVAHLADPNNPAELDYKIWTHDAVSNESTYYDDTIVYNWQGANEVYNPDTTTEQNIDGLNTAVLDQTTIQNFTAQLLGQETATIEDLANYLRAQADGAFDNLVDADLIIRFFQEGFGIAPDIRAEATTLRFVPDDLADGVRWDNRLNWDTDDLPGLHAGDSVDLGGNHVTYGTNAAIDSLDFGADGALNVYGGRLTLNGGITGDDTGHLNVEGAGQIWTNGSDAADLDITLSGGRFANTGLMQNADLTATGGQAILATEGGEFDLGAGHTLAVTGGATVGFDGDDGQTAILDMHEGATLAFGADDTGEMGAIGEFRSGALGETPNVQSGIDLGDATLEIDLSGLSASAGTAFTLMDADEIVGLFNDATVGGLGARDATIVIDYVSDSVTLELTSGSGAVSVQTLGDQTDVSAGNQSLWDTLTADQGVVSETLAAMVPDEDELVDPVIAA